MQTWLQFGGEFVDPPRIGLPCGQIQRFEQVRKCFDYGVALSTDGVTRSLVQIKLVCHPPASHDGESEMCLEPRRRLSASKLIRRTVDGATCCDQPFGQHRDRLVLHEYDEHIECRQ